MVPNGVRVLANSPAALSGWWQFEAALEQGSLPRPLREQFAVLTANANGCTYCLSAHTAAGKAVGVSADDIATARRAEASEPYAAAVLAFAAAVIDQRGAIDDQALAVAHTAGLTDAELIEIVAVIAINTFTNLYNRLAAPELDFPPVEVQAATI